MLDALQGALEPGAILIMAAAVADYSPADPASRKLKRADADLVLRLVPAPDILRSLNRPPGLRVVAFAAETNDLAAHAMAKVVAKGAEMLVANDVTEDGAGFDSDTNHVWVFRPNQPPVEMARAPKRAVADRILDSLLGKVSSI
jgi:phosphopantothenoylcysteine decarboxylase / phosphopantothenate---cysteine ligase